ncbi:MAG: glycosyltransferase family 2 protein [Anaerolineae bacterium]
MAAPFFSIIIPVHNGTATLGQCLQSVFDSAFREWELIVVDDGSTDSSAEVARQAGLRVMVTDGRLGPAAARNLGAEAANGRYLFFTDADCQLHRETLARAAHILQADAGLDALFGSYDDEPAASNFISQYKNLFHHAIHQTSSEKATTFWAGCGAIRRDRFLVLGGFDARRYPRPAIEDVELGYRLTQASGRIRLAKEVQVKHLKRWTLISLLRSDICDRAIPWARLLHQQRPMPADLNLQMHHRLSAAALSLMLAMLLWGGTAVSLLPLTLALTSGIFLLWLNHDLYRFFYRKRGLIFTLRAIPLHWLYYTYSAAVFGVVKLLFGVNRKSHYTF